MSHSKRVPFHLLSGFLGSGKTTLLNRLLKLKEFENTLVIVNEFGSVPIDHLLVETSTEAIFELANGCLCCSIRGELIETLANLDLTQFDRVVVETTGIADPMPIFQAVVADPEISVKLSPQGIISVFDLVRGDTLLNDHQEARKQIAVSDLILLTKRDCDHDKASSVAAIQRFNPHAVIAYADDFLDKPKLPDRWTKADYMDETKPVGHTHAERYETRVLETDTRLAFSDLIGFLHMLSNQLGTGLLRLKGFALLNDRKQPVVIQMSGQLLHPPIAVDNPANFPEKTQLVVITKGVDSNVATELFRGFAGDPQIDSPDREAILNNPLSIPGV